MIQFHLAVELYLLLQTCLQLAAFILRRANRVDAFDLRFE